MAASCLLLIPLLVLSLAAGYATAKPRAHAKKTTQSPAAAGAPADPFVCDADKLLVYRVTLSTHWSRTNFPKQYPEWRPPAQWSKLIGNVCKFLNKLKRCVHATIALSCNGL